MATTEIDSTVDAVIPRQRSRLRAGDDLRAFKAATQVIREYELSGPVPALQLKASPVLIHSGRKTDLVGAEKETAKRVDCTSSRILLLVAFRSIQARR